MEYIFCIFISLFSSIESIIIERSIIDTSLELSILILSLVWDEIMIYVYIKCYQIFLIII